MDSLTELRRAIRAHVCMECPRQPTGSHMLGPDAARACEGTCEVFHYLPRLTALVRRHGGEPPCGYRSAIQSLVCTGCGTNEGRACSCDEAPLVRFASEVLATLESLHRPTAHDLRVIHLTHHP